MGKNLGNTIDDASVPTHRVRGKGFRTGGGYAQITERDLMLTTGGCCDALISETKRSVATNSSPRTTAARATRGGSSDGLPALRKSVRVESLTGHQRKRCGSRRGAAAIKHFVPVEICSVRCFLKTRYTRSIV
jgi:hypothetical protein